MKDLYELVASELNIGVKQVETTYKLIEEGATIPFVARYRKEMTGGLDEKQIKAVFDLYSYQANLKDRKEAVFKLIDEKGLMTPEIKKELDKAQKLVEVEDVYRPFKEKKKTKATEAIKQGLEPLAKEIIKFKNDDLTALAKPFVKDSVKTVKDALEGASYIIAEMISDDAKLRKSIRTHTTIFGAIETKRAKGEDEGKVFEMYYKDWSSPIKRMKNHWVLAIQRASKLKILNFKIALDVDKVHEFISKWYIKNDSMKNTVKFMQDSIADAYKRLVAPSVEREIWSEMLETAGYDAIKLFATNLKQLIMTPPIKGKKVLGFDPAFRTGCKLAAVNEFGDLEHICVIYPHQPVNKVKESKEKLAQVILDYKIDVIAIGNGTASRESEEFVAKLIEETGLNVQYVIVNESGASVYSASKAAQKEFPKLQVEERSAVSIARRLQEPLSELIKIDPKSIGVGQYQHDVNQKQLNDELNFVVESAVNSVGVNVNTASEKLLSYVAGINATAAKKIMEYRKAKKGIKNREELKKISSITDNVFEQASGFLRILDGDNPLDKTSIHPESYVAAKIIMDDLAITTNDMGSDKVIKIIDGLTDKHKNELMAKTSIDQYTLDEIINSFKKPLQDPRDEIEQVKFKSTILKITDLNVGTELSGVVRNIVDFGAFIDIGLKNDALAHISKLKKGFVKHPSDVVSIGDQVTCWVEKIDKEKNKVNVTLLDPTGGK